MIEKIAYLIIGASLAVVLTTFIPMQHMTNMSGDMTEAETAMQTPEHNMQGMEVDHKHPPRAVSTEQPIPSVTHLMFPDMMDGFNVQVIASNFTFTPSSINKAAVYNEGHAHIYVNDLKIARLYAPWFHLPRSLFKSGENYVRVTINANDHSEWFNNGQPISSVVQVVIP